MKKTAFLFSLLLISIASCSGNKTQQLQNATSNPDSLIGKNTYVNPNDGKTYTSEGAFKEYSPEGGVMPSSGNVRPVNIVLLTNQNELESIVGIDNLANFIKGADEVVKKELTNTKEAGRIMIQYTLYVHKKPDISLSYDGNFLKKDLQRVSDKLEKYSANNRIKRDSCIFQNIYEVNKNGK
jgi:hypothetical protein